VKKLNDAVTKTIKILDEEIADKNMVKALQPKSKVQLTPAAAWPFPTRSREVMESD
jgi:F420-dependent methylenetetrahydromethanopterin dehydrogenase